MRTTQWKRKGTHIGTGNPPAGFYLFAFVCPALNPGFADSKLSTTCVYSIERQCCLPLARLRCFFTRFLTFRRVFLGVMVHQIL